MITRAGFLLFSAGALLLSTTTARADLRAEKIHSADGKKNRIYIRDGLVVGGDRAIDEFVVKDIRRAANPGFERVVIDIEGLRHGESAAIPRPPYYQVAITPDENRIVLTFWGKHRVNLDPGRIRASFRKSAVVKSVLLLPTIEEDTWTFALELKSGPPVEVFELGNPTRIILDIQTKAPGGAKPLEGPGDSSAEESQG